MNGNSGFSRWAAVAFAALIAVGVGVFAYQAGVAHGLAVQLPAGAAPPVVMPYGWYRPWGFFPFGPVFFLLFWFVLLRAAFWGGRRRRWCGRYPTDVPPGFDEWHRRAHEQMNKTV